jgi:membrane protein required for colicin V production
VNLYDVIVLVILGLLAVRGLRRGLLATFLGLVAFAAGVFLGLRYDGALGGLLRGHLGLTATEARIAAFLVIILAVGIAVRIVSGLFSGVIRRAPFVGAINRLGGLGVGLIVGCLAVWLVTGALLLVPYWLVPFSATVHHSETAHLLAQVTPHWDSDLRTYLDNFTAGRLSPALQRELHRLSVEHLLSSPRP